MIGNIYEEIKTKNPHVRLHCSEYFIIILDLYDTNDLNHHHLQMIEEFIIMQVVDAKP